MSLNDPFGRVSRRQQQAYERFREQLQSQGISTVEALQDALAGLNRMALSLAAIALVAAAVGALIFSGARAILIVCAALALLWLGSSYLQTRTHLARYRNELAASNAAARATDDDSTTLEETQK